MRKDFEKLFIYLESPEPPVGLLDKIMLRIRKEEFLFSIRRRLIFFSAAVLISAGACIPALIAFGREFADSGSFYYASLIFSDLGIVAHNWQDFILVVLESLPTASMITSLLAMLAFVWSLERLFQATKIVLYPHRLITN